jgi:hypothetical protein
MIAALENTLIAFPAGGKFAHFIVSGKALLRTTLPNYTPIVEVSNFAYLVLPPANKISTAVTDSLNYHTNTAKGRTRLHDLYS